MKKQIEDLGGTGLEYVDTPIAETSQRMPQLTTSLLQKYGDKWTHSLAINDLYFDFMGPSLAAAGLPACRPAGRWPAGQCRCRRWFGKCLSAYPRRPVSGGHRCRTALHAGLAARR